MDPSSGLADAVAPDRRAIAAIGEALAGSGRPFVGTCGTMVLTPGRVGTEDDPADAASAAGFRAASETQVLALAGRSVRASVVRPAPSVHGEGDRKGFVAAFIQAARDKGASAYVGDGSNRWPAVHRLDAAHLFRLALEKGAACSRYHAVGDEGVPFRRIAETIGRRLGVPTVALSPETAAYHFGPYAAFASVDNPAANALTQARLGRSPSHPGLIADLGAPHYFQT